MDSIEQHSLHDELLARLRRMIIDGQFRPGDKVPERQLCDHFGVSRTPLREALKVLAAEGLIELAPNRGAMIAAVNAHDLEEVLPISVAIEALSGELACEHITDAEINEIKALHAEMVADFEAGRFKSYYDKNRDIHQHIVTAARNPLLANLYDTLFFRIGRSRFANDMPWDVLQQDLTYHKQIIKALEERQGERLADLLKSHLETFFRPI
ncbi:MAG: GntR family transcriptional regulator [Rhodomicrobium sp.]|nr:GntR family transcriptional regulator [Rhodomicrobium sp.]